MKTISIGAEAVVYADETNCTVIKQRQPKKYRIKEIDDMLRLHRMKREVKIAESLQQLGIPVPKILEADEETATITMQLIDGEKVRDILNGSSYAKIAEDIGKNIGIMHENNIVHGDLTTSNMIRSSTTFLTKRLIKKRDEKIYFVDFGLSLFSKKDEDKAVDLHLFRQALNSSHSGIAEECFAAAIKAYKQSNGSGWKAVLKRLEKVEGRGRNKGRKADQAIREAISRLA